MTTAAKHPYIYWVQLEDKSAPWIGWDLIYSTPQAIVSALRRNKRYQQGQIRVRSIRRTKTRASKSNVETAAQQGNLGQFTWEHFTPPILKGKVSQSGGATIQPAVKTI
jgi:hypothetical protein